MSRVLSLAGIGIINNKTRCSPTQKHGRSGFSEPATRLVGDEPEGGEVLVLGGFGLDPHRVPGELLEVKHLALGKCHI